MLMFLFLSEKGNLLHHVFRFFALLALRSEEQTVARSPEPLQAKRVQYSKKTKIPSSV